MVQCVCLSEQMRLAITYAARQTQFAPKLAPPLESMACCLCTGLAARQHNDRMVVRKRILFVYNQAQFQ